MPNIRGEISLAYLKGERTIRSQQDPESEERGPDSC